MSDAITGPQGGSPLLPEADDLYHPHSWWTRYVFSQDAKVIAIQYAGTALAIGFVALILSWFIRLQLGFPGLATFIGPAEYYQLITMHGMIMVVYMLTAVFLGGFGNYLIPPDARRAGHGLPVPEHAELLDLPLGRPGSRGQLLRPRRADWRRLDPLPAPIHPGRNPWAGVGHCPDARLAHPVHRRLHHGRRELRRDGAAGARARHDADAHAADGLGGSSRRPFWRCSPFRRCSSVP
ncbi:protein of unknown function [Methylorubrum extorquens]|uniref:Cytochrome oxidase subunit I profile domain-containing protein n=1 Tax=Methylorubrum extorquens TaxID=408 RepID=A0A2N9AYN8_METEX|nr:protein of unknown function [Methylorubrum extorquens]